MTMRRNSPRGPLPDSALPAAIADTEHEIAGYTKKLAAAAKKRATLDAASAEYLEAFGAETLEQVAEKAAGARDELRRTRLRSAFVEESHFAGVDAAAAWPILCQLGRLDGIDPTSPGARAEITAEVRSALELEPRLAASKPAPIRLRSRLLVDDSPQPTDQIDIDVLGTMTPAEINQARLSGRLDTIGDDA